MHTLDIHQQAAVSGAGSSDMLVELSAAFGLYLSCKSGTENLLEAKSLDDLGKQVLNFCKGVGISVVGFSCLAACLGSYHEESMRPYTSPNHVFVRRVRG